MSENKCPAMSVILATADTYESIRATVRHLWAQNVVNQIELVIVAPSASAVNLVDDELKSFFRYVVVEGGPGQSVGLANALGVRHATAPVIALAEDHAFPAPGWAEALIAAHREPWAAVGPVVRNANPKSRLSRADLLISYGPWMDPAPAGPVDYLPGHNTSYKRELLLGYGADLDSMMEGETSLHWDLRSKGHKLYLEPAAKIAHMNFAVLIPFMQVHLYGGRGFATTRAQNAQWGWGKRLFFSCASPLIPAVRLWRILREMGRHGRSRVPVVRVLPQILIGLAADATGQMLGYTLGAGKTTAKLTRLEHHRYRYASKSAYQADRR